MCLLKFKIHYCSWFTFTWFILDLRTFVAKSAFSRLRALGGTFWPKLVGGGTKTFSRTGWRVTSGMASGNSGPALKISWGPPTANLWPDWSPQKRVNRDKLDQWQKMRKSRFNHQFCSKTCFNHQYCTKITYFFIIQCFIVKYIAVWTW